MCVSQRPELRWITVGLGSSRPVPAARREASKGSQQTLGLSHPVKVAGKHGKAGRLFVACFRLGCRAGAGRAGQGREGQGAGQSRAGQGRARQGMHGIFKARSLKPASLEPQTPESAS